MIRKRELLASAAGGESFTVTIAGWLRAKAPSALRGTK